MALQVGQQAPDFTLYDTDKNPVSLKDQKGSKVVLLFFPGAFTSVCTQEMCNMRDSLSVYNNANAKVFGISVDTPFTLQKFKESENLNFPLLSDFNKTVIKDYDVNLQDFVMGMQGVAKRAVFVIDEQGKIMHSEVLDNPGNQPDLKKVEEIVGKKS